MRLLRKFLSAMVGAAVMTGAASCINVRDREDHSRDLRPVPELRGVLLAEARQTLERAGFRVKVVEVPSGGNAPGTVDGTRPLSGFPFKEGQEVDLFVSRG